ncbi:MAG: TolC family protein [Bacteroidales bacterium]|jgi:outer membrane protein TolC|nr:TolC family protein [Bacteroidales bacterium]
MTKKQFRLIALGVMVFSASITLAQTKQTKNENDVLPLDLETALHIATDQNPTIKIANLEIQRIDYSRKETIGSLLPNVSATGQYVNNVMKSVMFVPEAMAAMAGGKKYMELGYNNSYTASVSAALPLINFSLWESIKAKQYDIDLVLEQARASKIDMIKQVKDAYYTTLLAKSSLEVLEQSIANAKETLKSTKTAYEQGVVSEYDYIRASVQVNNLNPAYISAKNGVELSLLQLKMLLSLPANQELEIKETLESFSTNMSLLDLIADNTALDNNTEIKQIDLNIKNLQSKLKLVNSQHIPSLSAFAQYTYQTQADDFKFKDYNWVGSAQIGLQLSVPIFSGLSVVHQAKQTKIAIQELELQKNYVIDGMDLQVRSAIDNMKAAHEQLIANEDAISQAERGYEIAKVRYQTGTGTILELNDSELSMTQAKLNYQNSLFNFLTAQSNLDKVLGKE